MIISGAAWLPDSSVSGFGGEWRESVTSPTALKRFESVIGKPIIRQGQPVSWSADLSNGHRLISPPPPAAPGAVLPLK